MKTKTVLCMVCLKTPIAGRIGVCLGCAKKRLVRADAQPSAPTRLGKLIVSFYREHVRTSELEGGGK